MLWCLYKLMNKVMHFYNRIFSQRKWMGKELTYLQRQSNCTYHCNGRGEPTASYGKTN